MNYLHSFISFFLRGRIKAAADNSSPCRGEDGRGAWEARSSLSPHPNSPPVGERIRQSADDSLSLQGEGNAKEFKALSHESVRVLIRETVEETLAGLGFDTSNPVQTQADLFYLRKLRHGSEEARCIISRSVLTLVVTSLLYMVWEGVRKKL